MQVVILDSGYKSYEFEKELFNESGFRLKIHPQYKGNRAEKIEFAKDADGLLLRHTRVDNEFLSEMKNLKAIVRYGVGYDNIDVDACTRFGVKVANVQGYANHSVSEHALALMLSCSRALWNPRQQLLHQFAAPPADDVFELHDKTLGIIGLGRIGSELSKKASSLFKRVIAYDPYKSDSHFETLNIDKVSQEYLLKVSDVISLHCNLTKETTHLISQNALSTTEKKPILINTSRGEVIDEQALFNALKKDKIHSAGLDVFENEPVTDAQKKLINHPRTICTGHYAWYSNYSVVELQKRAALNLLQLLTGEEVEDSLN